MLSTLVDMLDSQDIDILQEACTILGNLAEWRFGNTVIVKLNPCARLVTLARHTNVTVGARALVEAKVDLLAVDFLHSEDLDILDGLARMLGDMFCHGEWLTVLELNVQLHFVELESSVEIEALYAHCSIDEMLKPKSPVVTFITKCARLHAHTNNPAPPLVAQAPSPCSSYSGNRRPDWRFSELIDSTRLVLRKLIQNNMFISANKSLLPFTGIPLRE
ncbi:hypothetical protein C8R43DRAFT_168057 [Mycena crocata]|nr:hypothetical protein C8R43DRAFT_168057 [Mycena crocata]